MEKNFQNQKPFNSMTLEREIIIEGTKYKITVSDDSKALCSAYAEGRAVIGLWDRSDPGQSLSPAVYIVESIKDIDTEFLEKVVRRRHGLPFQIVKTDRLIVREFISDDSHKVPREPDGGENGAVFYHQDSLNDYIRCQYGFFEYGIWALMDHKTGMLVGKAGIIPMDLSGMEEFLPFIKEKDTPLELGYHIFSSYRKNGYAKEGCKAIVSYASERIAPKIYARILQDNLPSMKLIEALGFTLIAQTCNESGHVLCLYEWSLS
ncbi:GNAT family N-acetyltransferase [Lacrimispora algidixylanolytica]|nr:GNAT family N-acetyltransferase [Lacrimispora algidixylanolytica]